MGAVLEKPSQGTGDPDDAGEGGASGGIASKSIGNTATADASVDLRQDKRSKQAQEEKHEAEIPHDDTSMPNSTGYTGTQPQQPQQETLSKNARKKRAREERWEAVKRARKAERKKARAHRNEEKRREREERFASMDEPERAKVEQERKEKLLALRKKQRDARDRVHAVLGGGEVDAEGNRISKGNGTRYEVCIDLGWNEQMAEKERKSLCRQLMYSYNSIRKCVCDDDGDEDEVNGSSSVSDREVRPIETNVEDPLYEQQPKQRRMVPLKLIICGVDEHLEPSLDTSANGWRGWPITVSRQSLAGFYKEKKKSLVYLTHDAEEVLDELRDDEVYVIGGIVDRNRLKGITMAKAKEMGIRAARLNLDTNVSLEHGTRVLTVNHCVDILLHRANGRSWADAYLQVLPERKGLSSNVPQKETVDANKDGNGDGKNNKMEPERIPEQDTGNNNNNNNNSTNINSNNDNTTDWKEKSVANAKSTDCTTVEKKATATFLSATGDVDDAGTGSGADAGAYDVGNTGESLMVNGNTNGANVIANNTNA